MLSPLPVSSQIGFHGREHTRPLQATLPAIFEPVLKLPWVFTVAIWPDVYHGRVDTAAPEHKRQAAVSKVLGEALLVACLGAALAFTANAISPRGLKLSQNYFLTGANEFAINQPSALTAANRPANGTAGTNVIAAAPALISVPRLDEKGLQAIDGPQALKFFQDARREKDLLVFVDARGEDDYQRGHIPGATN